MHGSLPRAFISNEGEKRWDYRFRVETTRIVELFGIEWLFWGLCSTVVLIFGACGLGVARQVGWCALGVHSFLSPENVLEA